MMQEFVQQVKETISESLDGVHTCIPGEIVSFDAGNCTAVVKPIGKIKRPDGQKIDYPQIAKVPVHFQQSSTQESCICFRKPNALMQEAQSKDAIIIRQKDSRAMFSNNEVLIKRNDSQFMQMKGGTITLKNAGTTLTITGSGADLIGNLTVSGKITAQGDVIGAGISLKNHTHTDVTSGDGTSGPPSA